VLPDGLCVARCLTSDESIGTASAIHHPRASRFFFPGGGELGYLVVAESHRGRGVGRALVWRVINRFRAAGYRTIFLRVQGWRLAAIRCYLAAGFLPFVHPAPPELVLEARWRRVFDTLGIAANPDTWPRAL
jgi:GNAT superfamily N-acetyltransferase